MKSNFWNSCSQKCQFWHFLRFWICDFSTFELFLKSQIYQNSKLSVSEIVEMAIFEIKMLLNFISHKIECQSNFWNLDLNFTFWKFLEHSAMQACLMFIHYHCTVKERVLWSNLGSDFYSALNLDWLSYQNQRFLKAQFWPKMSYKIVEKWNFSSLEKWNLSLSI